MKVTSSHEEARGTALSRRHTHKPPTYTLRETTDTHDIVD